MSSIIYTLVYNMKNPTFRWHPSPGHDGRESPVVRWSALGCFLYSLLLGFFFGTTVWIGNCQNSRNKKAEPFDPALVLSILYLTC